MVGQPHGVLAEHPADGVTFVVGNLEIAERFILLQGEFYRLYVDLDEATRLEARREVGFETEGGSDSVLLRADRAAYVVGETMDLVALTPVESGGCSAKQDVPALPGALDLLDLGGIPGACPRPAGRA